MLLSGHKLLERSGNGSGRSRFFVRERRLPFCGVGGGTAYKSQRQSVSIISSDPEIMVTIAAARIAAVPFVVCLVGIRAFRHCSHTIKKKIAFQTNGEFSKMKDFCF